MAWLSTIEIRNKFSITSGRYDQQIEYAIASAALVLQRGVDADVYAEALADTPPTDPDELLRYSSVVESHSYLTMWFLVGNVGNKLGETGFIKSQQDAGSPAQNSRVVTNSYLTPAEIADMRSNLLMNARTHLGDYGVITVEVIEPPTEAQQLSISSLQWF
jgi:hypothetical protein